MKEISYKDLELNPFTSIGKDAFLLCTESKEGRNIMTVGWASLGFLWGRPTITIYVRPTRYTHKILENSSTFSCVFLSKEYKKVISYAGTASGSYEDKIKGSGLSLKTINDEKTGKSYFTFKEADLTLTCTKAYKADLKEKNFIDKTIITHYPEKDFHTEYIAYIDGVFV